MTPTFEEWFKIEWGKDTPHPGQRAAAKKAWWAAQYSMRERAAVSQCYHCQQGKPIDHIDCGRAFHLDPKGCPTYCTGQDIRALGVE